MTLRPLAPGQPPATVMANRFSGGHTHYDYTSAYGDIYGLQPAPPNRPTHPAAAKPEKAPLLSRLAGILRALGLPVKAAPKPAPAVTLTLPSESDRLRAEMHQIRNKRSEEIPADGEPEAATQPDSTPPNDEADEDDAPRILSFEEALRARQKRHG